MTMVEGNTNIVSVSFGDHLNHGDGESRLYNPVALARRMSHWRRDLGANTLHWRVLNTRNSGWMHRAEETSVPIVDNSIHRGWDDLDWVPYLAHQAGMRVYAYVTLFDEGWPLLSESEQDKSFISKRFGKHESWQSAFALQHPEYHVVDQSGHNRQWGVLELAYPEVRQYFTQLFLSYLVGRQFDGLFVCLRSRSKPAEHADLYGFNEPIRQEYFARFGQDICHHGFKRQPWRDLRGAYLTKFLRELKAELQPMGLPLAVGIPRGNVLGPPMGNMTMAWWQWVEQSLVDEIVMNQSSRRCPSFGHTFWPMHKGIGYLQNYDTGAGMESLGAQLKKSYLPQIQNTATKLYVASQWEGEGFHANQDLLRLPGISGLVYNSYMNDHQPESLLALAS